MRRQSPGAERRTAATLVSALLPRQRTVTGEDPRTGGGGHGTLPVAQGARRASAERYVRMDAEHP
jgi:hypothetical protein